VSVLGSAVCIAARPKLMGCGISSKVESTPIRGPQTSDQSLTLTLGLSSALRESHVLRGGGDDSRNSYVSWRKGDLIGTGANGRVYLGLEEESGAIIAIKEMAFNNEQHFSVLFKNIEKSHAGKNWRNWPRCKGK